MKLSREEEEEEKEPTKNITDLDKKREGTRNGRIHKDKSKDSHLLWSQRHLLFLDSNSLQMIDSVINRVWWRDQPNSL